MQGVARWYAALFTEPQEDWVVAMETAYSHGVPITSRVNVSLLDRVCRARGAV